MCLYFFFDKHMCLYLVLYILFTVNLKFKKRKKKKEKKKKKRRFVVGQLAEQNLVIFIFLCDRIKYYFL